MAAILSQPQCVNMLQTGPILVNKAELTTTENPYLSIWVNY